MVVTVNGVSAHPSLMVVLVSSLVAKDGYGRVCRTSSRFLSSRSVNRMLSQSAVSLSWKFVFITVSIVVLASIVIR